MSWIALLLACLSCICFTAKRLLRLMRYLQQEGYDSRRFLSWFWTHRAFDKRGSLIALGSGIFTANFLGVCCLLGLSLLEENPMQSGKIRLKMTARAQRIYGVAFALYLLSLIPVVWSFSGNFAFFWLLQILFFQGMPLFLVMSCFILEKDEQRRQNKLVDQAKQRLQEIHPYMIGITGSYGKTSTKNALGQLLQVTLGSTFWPGQGVNTVMGNTREILNRLAPGTQYAVMEMGAYGIGSISRLCALTPPQAGIITMIGTAHLERFGSQDTIQKAKAELAQAIPEDGILVCNGDDPRVRAIARDHPKRTTLFYGFDASEGPLDCKIAHWEITAEGTAFTLIWKDQSYSGMTPLYGRTSLSNAVAAFTMACALGSHPEYVVASMHHLQPVNNRLQIRKEKGITYLQDAYNSNPEGFSSALSVMRALPGQRRLLMTPGLIELGAWQQVQNEKIGCLAAQHCDIALVVGSTNQEALVKGLQTGGVPEKNILLFPTRESAFIHLKSLVREGDIVLIENDLGDTYDARPKF